MQLFGVPAIQNLQINAECLESPEKAQIVERGQRNRLSLDAASETLLLFFGLCRNGLL